MSTGRKQYRCAVYTRKSSEEGLEQDFNSLQAQREACEAYIASQKHEGWKLVPTAFDDGGISGGTMERPGLQRLLADIKSGQIDVIVVYKVDRLTRSLADFAKMVEVFDAHGVSFVAVTQQFNTTTSMGRLTLNVLLSFAQFEREVTGERIRDKIDASKKKGMWMGGPVPLGYRVEDRKLIIVPDEAEAVRQIFRRYLHCSGVSELVTELKAAGIRSKPRDENPGGVIARGAVYCLLSNPIYRGEIRHKGSCYPGQHEPIVDRALWDAVQAKLAAAASRSGPVTRKTDVSPLLGKILDEQGVALTPSHAAKGGRRYRYYISNRSHLPSPSTDTGWRLPALQIERQVEMAVRTMLDDQPAIARAVMIAGVPESEIRAVLRSIAAGTDQRQENPQPLALVEQVQLGTNLMRLRIGLPYEKAIAMERDFPMLIKRRGIEMRLVIPGVKTAAADPDPTLLKAIGRALAWWERLQSGRAASVTDIAKREGLEEGYVRRLLPLAFLSPDLVEACLAGRQPQDLTVKRLITGFELPLAWSEQRGSVGMAR